MADYALKVVRMNLARTKEFPEGSERHYYQFTAPLDADGRLDAEGWRQNRDRTRVKRVWAEEEEDVGHLVHRPGGSWGFTYDIDGDEGDEAGYRLGSHRFVPGEYVSVRDEDGEMHTFVVVTVLDVA